MTVYKDLKLELSTDHDEIQYTHEQNSASWRNLLTVEEYMERERFVGLEHEVCERDHEKNLGLYHFVLKDYSIPIINSKFDQIVASCETRNRIGYVAEPGATELKEVVSPCIGSVYTLSHHRRKGYAGKMITFVNEYWSKRLGEDTFMTLYSEVGDYYSRFGYKSFEVLDNKLEIKADETGSIVCTTDYESLRMDQYKDLMKAENELLKKELLAKAQKSDKKLIAMELNSDIFTWFHVRDKFTNSKVNKTSKPTTVAGAQLKNSEDHIIWLHDWLSDGVTVLKLKFSSLDSFRKLVALAHNEAKINGLHILELWDSALGEDEQLHKQAHEYLKSEYEGKFDQPNSSLSAAKLTTSEDVEFGWEFNDKWCWF